MERENAWKSYTDQDKSELNELCEGYKSFLSQCKTERLATKRAIELASAAGYAPLAEAIAEKRALKPGDKVWINNYGKAIMLVQIGTNDIEAGVNILGAHIDSPRLDLKQNPLYEASDFVLLDTHYYGGIKNYQWVALPLALKGVVAKKDGTVVDISLGDDPSDPVFCVTDLLPHLGAEQMKKNGFTNYTFVEKTDATVEKGYVISQSIDDGTSITKDTQITIYVSSGKEKTKVPNVLGYEDSQATTLLEEAGLKVTHGYAYDDNVEKDHVISSDPVAGTEVEEGSTVKIIISNGKETKKIAVPNLKGRSEADAAAKLQEVNLVGNPSYEYSDDVKEGQVISQDPEVNTEVDEGTTVSYVVSKGPQKVTYSVSFSGSISNIEFDFDTFGSVTVDISYTIGRQTFSVYSGKAGAGDFPINIDGVEGPTGLESNQGSFSVTITDSEGIDVTSSFNTGGLSATFTQESN